MKRSVLAAASSPAISLLSSSPTASRRLQDLFATHFRLEPLSLDTCTTSALDSVALQCPSSNTLLHLVSSKDAQDTALADEGQCALSLLAITTDDDTLTHTRQILESHLERNADWKRSLGKALGYNTLKKAHFMGTKQSKGGLVILDLPQTTATAAVADKSFGIIKEVVIPHNEDATYRDKSGLLRKLSSCRGLDRPVVGVYRHTLLGIRPLPAAKQDLTLTAPTLVFSCRNLDGKYHEICQDTQFEAHRIGFNGAGRQGQLIVQHEKVKGLELRFCDSQNFYSSFAEAQDALLAGSLGELQSEHVMGSSLGEDGRLGDCWMEFRANLKHPMGFLRKRHENAKEHIVSTRE